MTLSFRTYTCRSGQTVQTQIRPLLEEQSDKGLHCFLFHLHHLTKYPKVWPHCLNLGRSQQSFLASENLGNVRYTESTCAQVLQEIIQPLFSFAINPCQIVNRIKMKHAFIFSRNSSHMAMMARKPVFTIYTCSTHNILGADCLTIVDH